MQTATLVSRNFGAFLLLWLVLSGGSQDQLPAGLLAAAASTVVSYRLAPPGRWRPARILALAPHFFWRSLVGGIDVARRALHPGMPLNSGWIRWPAHLPPGTPQVLLGGELSLQPGTLSAGVDESWLLIHTLDTGLPVDCIVADEEDRCERSGNFW